MTLREYEEWSARRRALAAIRAVARHVSRLAKQETRRTTHSLAGLSGEDRRIAYNAAQRAAYRRDPSAWYAAAYRRRARMKGAAVVEEISRLAVFDRDGWRCRYCRRPVRDDVPRGHPRKAIMAHIVALARGGDHSWANVCCLCHECNCRDGVGKLPIQMGLG